MESKRAAIYVRVSSKVQEDGYGPEVQERECRELAERNGLEVVAIFNDTHTGVELWERPAVNQLRDGMRKREFDAIIFQVLDRIARDPIYQQIIIAEAHHYGVAVHSVHEDLDHSDNEYTP